MAKESRVAFDEVGLYFSNTVYFIPSNNLYLLALLNSKLIFSYYKRIAAVLGDPDKGGRLRWFRQDVIETSNPTNLISMIPSEKPTHDEIVNLVEKILKLQKERQAIKQGYEFDDARDLENEIQRADDEIDKRI